MCSISEAYGGLQHRLTAAKAVMLDGGVGSEFERHGVPMDHDSRCGPVTMKHIPALEAAHRRSGLDGLALSANLVRQVVVSPPGRPRPHEKPGVG